MIISDGVMNEIDSNLSRIHTYIVEQVIQMKCNYECVLMEAQVHMGACVSD